MGPDNKGMLAKILCNNTYHNMMFEYQAVIENGKADTDSDMAVLWKGCREYYTITQTDDITTIFVQIDVPIKYIESFAEAFPKALEKVMELAEGK